MTLLQAATSPNHHAQRNDLWSARDEACLLLRRQIRKQRRELSEAFQQQAASAAQARLVALLEQLQTTGQKINTLSLYFSCDGELNTRPLFETLWQRDIQTCLPVLHPFTPGNLLFLHYHADSPMTFNRFGIPEPKLETRRIVLPAQLDLILTPLVAFDAQGNRMGMGGGYYDRTLANPQVTALAVGYAHDCQQAESLPLAPWDKPLPVIITPSQTLDNR
ncbi:5-formyltetrahydrofolate cyclo-ligase [Shewanella yunxiaonensis]|uniref:5-formyltetrahydrofolate cyclo-ligase n=1 Tax=Shewanella yunxiaonensis TaxID=2829809 RepID=A0ABX7YSB6_9GAMM|nr:5-formyltetrahydrofolate cyclo-ligase [Shewanella yunxiaonensis]QUN05191.1 5-formyltetrahydrofolate cyclo-ligase [Shewanella yunxiaonensis]